MDEPTAIRHPKRGKAHRPIPSNHAWTQGRYIPGEVTACNTDVSVAHRGWTERVPLTLVAPEDRCKTCWKDTP